MDVKNELSFKIINLDSMEFTTQLSRKTSNRISFTSYILWSFHPRIKLKMVPMLDI